MDLAMEETLRFKDVEEALSSIINICNSSFRRELCGFLGYDHESNEYLVQEEKNISPEPESHFLINPLNYLLLKMTMTWLLFSIVMSWEMRRNLNLT